jgi:hypothetical protein
MIRKIKKEIRINKLMKLTNNYYQWNKELKKIIKEFGIKNEELTKLYEKIIEKI